MGFDGVAAALACLAVFDTRILLTQCVRTIPKYNQKIQPSLTLQVSTNYYAVTRSF